MDRAARIAELEAELRLLDIKAHELEEDGGILAVQPIPPLTDPPTRTAEQEVRFGVWCDVQARRTTLALRIVAVTRGEPEPEER
jgi:hypothetical protein